LANSSLLLAGIAKQRRNCDSDRPIPPFRNGHHFDSLSDYHAEFQRISNRGTKLSHISPATEQLVVRKLIWLQLREITQKWKMPPRDWSDVKVQLVVFGDRFEVNR